MPNIPSRTHRPSGSPNTVCHTDRPHNSVPIPENAHTNYSEPYNDRPALPSYVHQQFNFSKSCTLTLGVCQVFVYSSITSSPVYCPSCSAKFRTWSGPSFSRALDIDRPSLLTSVQHIHVSNKSCTVTVRICQFSVH